MLITKPTLIVDKKRVLNNIQKMAEKAKRSGVKFYPHCKTYQSVTVSNWLKDHGAEAITVSSVEMAQHFAYAGWEDITIAFPTNILEIENINKLAKSVELSLLVESEGTVLFLQEHLQQSVNIWIKIDVGYKRTGIEWNRTEEVLDLAEQISKSDRTNLIGLLAHSGHSYYVKSRDELALIYDTTVQRLKKIQERLYSEGFLGIQISIGDTPTCSVVESFYDVDVIRPGNFVFYDIKQLTIGSCDEVDIALAVACPVVAKHKDRNEVVIYGGAAHFSKDYVEENGKKVFGYVVPFEKNSWGLLNKINYLSSLSQEHGIVKVETALFEKTRVGDLLYILPIHACLAVNLFKRYYTLDGELIQTM